MLVGTLVNISTNASIQYPHREFPAEYLPWDAYNRGGGGGGGYKWNFLASVDYCLRGFILMDSLFQYMYISFHSKQFEVAVFIE